MWVTGRVAPEPDRLIGTSTYPATRREHNMIRFKDGKPVGIYYSQHGTGQACEWEDETCFFKYGNRVSDLGLLYVWIGQTEHVAAGRFQC